MFNNMVTFIRHRFYFALLRLKKEEQSLLKMGISQEQIKKLIIHWLQHQTLQESLGQIIWQTAKLKSISPREAGKRLSTGMYWDEWKKNVFSERRIR
ncbi:MAG: hypothetical protein KGZ96_00020 [Clostridia bacterium]|nr:hypothetical protein [Clostridia bacterium]